MCKQVNCDYCRKPAPLVKGDAIYPHRPDLWDKDFYKCEPCKAWVGCHPDTTRPLGRLANSELRSLKSQAHAVFDPLWRGNKTRTRKQAYQWLSERLGIKVKNCHIGYFDEATCKRVIEICEAC